MKPALTAEEWVGYSDHGDAICRGESQITAGLRGEDTLVIGVASEQFEYGAILPESCHAIAALCLNDQPFGFMREDVGGLRDMAREWEDDGNYGYLSTEIQWARNLATRIEALLPPEDA